MRAELTYPVSEDQLDGRFVSLDSALRVPQDITHLQQNQLVQQDALAHVRERDATQYDERADHVALSPCFQDQAVAIGWLGDCFVGRDGAIEQLWQGGEGERAHACGAEGGIVVGLKIVRYGVLSTGVSASLMHGGLWDVRRS